MPKPKYQEFLDQRVKNINSYCQTVLKTKTQYVPDLGFHGMTQRWVNAWPGCTLETPVDVIYHVIITHDGIREETSSVETWCKTPMEAGEKLMGHVGDYIKSQFTIDEGGKYHRLIMRRTLPEVTEFSKKKWVGYCRMAAREYLNA